MAPERSLPISSSQAIAATSESYWTVEKNGLNFWLKVSYATTRGTPPSPVVSSEEVEAGSDAVLVDSLVPVPFEQDAKADTDIAATSAIAHSRLRFVFMGDSLLISPARTGG